MPTRTRNRKKCNCGARDEDGNLIDHSNQNKNGCLKAKPGHNYYVKSDRYKGVHRERLSRSQSNDTMSHQTSTPRVRPESTRSLNTEALPTFSDATPLMFSQNGKERVLHVPSPIKGGPPIDISHEKVNHMETWINGGDGEGGFMFGGVVLSPEKSTDERQPKRRRMDDSEEETDQEDEYSDSWLHDDEDEEEEKQDEEEEKEAEEEVIASGDVSTYSIKRCIKLSQNHEMLAELERERAKMFGEPYKPPVWEWDTPEPVVQTMQAQQHGDTIVIPEPVTFISNDSNTIQILNVVVTQH